MSTLDIRTADELIDPELEARWVMRRAAPQRAVLRQVLHAFVDGTDPITAEAIAAALPDQPPGAVQDSLNRLDADDLIQLVDGRIELAYPFSAAPTSFVVRLADGQERFACCAIDALGIAPMLGRTVHLRSQCHHCRAPLEFSVRPDGPESGARDVMVWVGKRCQGPRRITAAL